MPITIKSIEEIKNIEAIKIEYVHDIAAITIKDIEHVAPAAVHIKELNNIDPLTIESLRVDSVRNLEPLNVDSLNVTRLPMVNLSMARMPTMDLNIRRMPPLAIGLHQEFELPSNYTIHTRFLGFEILRFDIHGNTRMVPRERVRREQSHNHERSFPDVAAVGNPAIPNRCRETHTEVRSEAPPCCTASTRCAPSAGLSAAAPQFNFSLSSANVSRVGQGG